MVFQGPARLSLALIFGSLLIWSATDTLILVVGSSTGLSGAALLYTLVLGTLSVTGFTALTVGISCLASTGRGVTLAALAIFIAMAAPTLLGTALQNSWFGTVYNALSPFAQVRLSLDSVIVDNEGLATQLPHLGALIAFVVLAGVFTAVVARRVSMEESG